MLIDVMRMYDPGVWWLLLPLALLVWLAARYLRWRREALARIGSRRRQQLRLTAVPRARPVFLLTGLATIALLIPALADMRIGGSKVQVPTPALDLAIVLDLSKSMDCRDILPSRMDRARQLTIDLISREVAGRTSLVVFAERAYLQCPLTSDADVLRQFAASLTTGTMPQQGTAVAQGLNVALESLFPEINDKHIRPTSNPKVVLLITDGEDHGGGKLNAAVNALARRAVKIYTVAVGTPAGGPIPAEEETGTGDFITDEDGKMVITRPDFGLLEDMSRRTGGRAYRMSRDQSTLEGLADALAGLRGYSKTVEIRVGEFPLYLIFVGLAILLLLRDLGLPLRRYTRIMADTITGTKQLRRSLKKNDAIH